MKIPTFPGGAHLQPYPPSQRLPRCTRSCHKDENSCPSPTHVGEIPHCPSSQCLKYPIPQLDSSSGESPWATTKRAGWETCNTAQLSLESIFFPSHNHSQSSLSVTILSRGNCHGLWFFFSNIALPNQAIIQPAPESAFEKLVPLSCLKTTHDSKQSTG